MIVSLISQLLSAWFAFLLPSYATYKALSRRPLSDPELERLAKYWTVIGAFVALQFAAEWLVSWLPFYWEVKTLFLLYLSLPQTQGSTYIYQVYFQPYFRNNEAELDAGIVEFQRKILGAVQYRLQALWAFVSSFLAKNSATAGQQPNNTGASQTPASVFSLQSVNALWQTYSPSVMSAFGSVSNATPAVRSSATGAAASQGVVEQRSVHSSSDDLPNPYISGQSAAASVPSFPQPQHFE